MSLPDFFQNKEQYEDWLDPIVDEQVDEILEYMDPSEIHKGTIDEWCRDAPFIAHDQQSLARIYHDVKAHSGRASITSYNDHFDHHTWFEAPYSCMATLVVEWIALDVSDLMQLEIENRGYPTGPPREEIEG